MEKEQEDLFDKDEDNMRAGMTNDYNMDGYINKYGQTFELPSYYIIDSTIFPRTSDESTTYTLTLVAFGVPNVTDQDDEQDQSDVLQVRTFNMNTLSVDNTTEPPID